VSEDSAAMVPPPSPTAGAGGGPLPVAAGHFDMSDDLALDFNPPVTIGTGTIIVAAGGVTETLVGAAEASTIWLNHGGAMEEFSGGPGANLLVSGGYDGTRMIGGTGIAEANTFILNSGIGAGTAAHVEIQNFNPAHDTLLLPAALYAGLGPDPVLAGVDGNVFVMPDQAAADRHDGAGAAVLIVGSGANADLFYYNPHDPHYGDQAHAYQLATISGVSPTDAAGHILFSNPQTPSTDGTV